MSALSRRAFLGASAASAVGCSSHAYAAQPPIPGGEDAPFQPSTLFLTWHRDPTTTMVVQWIGTKGETAEAKIYYRPSTTELSAPLAAGAGVPSALGTPPWSVMPTVAKPYPMSDFKVFRAELTGLRPGTEYQFKIGKESPTYRFRTMPAKATNPISFISGGDCGANAHAVANNIQAARQDPAFAIVGGDLAYENGKSLSTHMAFIRNYSRTMVAKGGRLIPMIACLGNHEVDGGFNQKREKAPFFYSLFDGLFTDTGFASLDFGDYLSLVLLDTGHTTAIEGEQTSWLESTLKARQDHPHTLIVNHVPAYPSARKAEGTLGVGGTGVGNRKHWVPLFEKYRVPVVLEHHDHTFKRTKPLIGGLAHDNGVLYLGDGSWGKIRALQPPERLGMMAVTSMDYHLSLHRLVGEERFHLALSEEGRVMDVTRTGQRKAGIVRVAS